MKISEIIIQNQSFQDEIKVEKAIGPEDFITLDILGQGSFGKVYLVKKKGTDQCFAMKTLSKEQVFGKNLIRYAKAERNILSIVKHPFIVSLHYAFQTKNKFYMVMDYCPGGDLDQKLYVIQRFRECTAKIYLAEVLLALEFLHENQIIFRDLKPSNIVLDSEGHARLTDFGLSKQGVLKQKMKSFCGSIAYLAPEMLESTGHNYTIDWYLFGVLIYELLSGYPPFYNENKAILIEGIRYGKLRFPKYFSPQAISIIEKLMVRNPDNRLGKNGASEIKSQAFFSDINFEKVLQKKYMLPKIQPRELGKELTAQQKKNLQITVSKNEDYLNSQKHGQHLDNWSFVIPEENEIFQNEIQ